MLERFPTDDKVLSLEASVTLKNRLLTVICHIFYAEKGEKRKKMVLMKKSIRCHHFRYIGEILHNFLVLNVHKFQAFNVTFFERAKKYMTFFDHHSHATVKEYSVKSKYNHRVEVRYLYHR